MNLSKRHHYIPQFLIKNFTDNDGFVYVYDKVNNRISNKKVSPKSIFFELYRNVTSINKKEVDNIEKLYSEIDNRIAPHIKKVINSKKFTPEECVSIIYLFDILRWRVPKSDVKFNIIKDSISSKDLGLSISTKDQNNVNLQNELNQILESETFKEAKRILIPTANISKTKNIEEIFRKGRILTMPNSSSILGDYPTIEGSINNSYGDFILPLGNQDSFVFKSKNFNKLKSNAFFVEKDLLQIKNAVRYVICGNQNLLKSRIEIFDKMVCDNNVENIGKYIFDHFE